MKQLFLALFFSLGCLSLSAQTIKGLPPNFTASELLIVAYEPSDLIPADAKSHESIYRQQTPLQTQCEQANKLLESAAKATYPISYRSVNKKELPGFAAQNQFIFEPAKFYGQLTIWSTTPLYIKNAATGEVYEIGFLPTSAIFEPDKIMEHFISFLPKNFPVQASDKVELKQKTISNE